MSTIGNPASTLEPPQRTVVELDHWVFRKMEGVRFHLHPSTNQPGMAVNMAKSEAFLTLQAVRKEFNIDSASPDGQMLNLISEGLKYVKGLVIGDPLPKEILTGEASWKVSPTHLAIAHQRIAQRLITLISMDEPTTNDPAELLKMSDDPEIKHKINEALAVAAVELGMEADQKQAVLDYVNILAGELGYIESLREKFLKIDKVRDKIQVVRKMYSGKPSVWDTSDQVARLMECARKEYGALFDEVDARTSDIMPMLRTLDLTIDFIRKHRDNLYIRLMAWDDIIAAWSESHVEYSVRINELLQKTHQFLAPRFMTYTDWTAKSRQEQIRRAKLKVQPMDW